MTRMFACALLALCACASTAGKNDRAKEMVLYSTAGAPKPEGVMICQLEYPTGSNIARRVCRYQNHADWNAQQAQQVMQELQQRPCAANCSGDR
jgi:hypothetical protein